MQIVAGLSLNNLRPRIWDKNSTFHLSGVKAVMVSYAEFDKAASRRSRAMEQGLHKYLNIPEHIQIFLDNGAFSFLRKGDGVPRDLYEEFVSEAKPDWYPIPQDYIPVPKMNDEEQLDCLNQTMAVNVAYRHDGYVPVVHICRHLDEYLTQFQANSQLLDKQGIALGGIVPNLLRSPKAMAYSDVLDHVMNVRNTLSDKQMHVFGIGGTATLHLARLFDIDSVDSAGWRNRAARGMVQLPGIGERVVAELGSWRGRRPSTEEWETLNACRCPACQANGVEGLKANKIAGFCNRATHNLWILLNEVNEIEKHLANDNYGEWYEDHLENSIYLPLIRKAWEYRTDRTEDAESSDIPAEQD